MNKKPFFSVIVCTRNRPNIIKCFITAMMNQSFKNFEFILSDNSDFPIRKKNYNFIKKLRFKQLKYVSPEKILNMSENYNFAISHATGEYIGVLTDKSFLRKNALKELYLYLEKKQVDIVNYNYGGCYWFPEKIFKWNLHMYPSRSDFEDYNPKEELSRRFNLKEPIGAEGYKHGFGKIFFGFYHYSLVKKIKEKYQSVFYGLSPDYTSLVLALNLADSAVFCHIRLLVCVNNYGGNGQGLQKDFNSVLEYFKTYTNDIDGLFKELPIPNVCTLHTCCAYDYQILNRFGETQYQINMSNLAQLTYKDLQAFPFSSEIQKTAFNNSFNEFLEKEKIAIVKIVKKDEAVSSCLSQRTPFREFFYQLRHSREKFQYLKFRYNDFRSIHHLSLLSMLE